MLRPTKDYLQRKAQALDLSRGDSLRLVQSYLDTLYPNQTRALSLNQGVLKIVTPNASLASELRLHQVAIVNTVNEQVAKRPIIKLQIQIRSLN